MHKKLPAICGCLHVVGTLVANATPCIAGEVISGQTQCRDVRAIFDAVSPDMQRVREVALALDREFWELDRQNAANGRPKIYARMSAKGRSSTSAAVTVACEQHPQDTIKERAAATYKAFEAMGDALGVNK